MLIYMGIASEHLFISKKSSLNISTIFVIKLTNMYALLRTVDLDNDVVF